jgi:hypothetical protein
MTDFSCPFTLQRIKRLQDLYGCTVEDAQNYLDLIEEGYSSTQALLLSGLSDPLEDEETEEA